MNKKTNTNKGRRSFIKKSGTAATAMFIVPRHVLGGKAYQAPSDKLNIAAIGVGGQGAHILRKASGFNQLTKGTKENVVALCDVDTAYAAKTFKQFPKAKVYKDFRKMLEENDTDIDAVMVATPDHTHAVIAMAAMDLGKHVYVEKPLTHNVYEARMLTQKAREKNLVTQMGNHGNSGEGIRRVCEYIWSGVIGDVTEAHAWTNRPVWPQGLPTPKDTPPIPDTLDWDLWLGPAQYRPYNPAYLPFSWRGWWDFGTGALGDMACHIIDPAFKALKLGYPSSVEASASVQWQNWNWLDNKDSAPIASIIHFEFPAREEMPACTLHWYDGGLMPRRPEELRDDEAFGNWDGGVLFVGTKGKLLCDCYGANPRLLPTSLMKELEKPEKSLPRIKGAPDSRHQTSWVDACKGEGPLPSSNFDYSGPLTETVVMGNLALKSYYVIKDTGKWEKEYPGRKKLMWDGQNMQITNFDAANEFVKRAYREGWSL